MAEYGGAYKGTREWQEISAIIDALYSGDAVPAMTTTIDEWLDLGAALAGLVGGFGTVGNPLLSSPNGRVLTNNSGVALTR